MIKDTDIIMFIMRCIYALNERLYLENKNI